MLSLPFLTLTWAVPPEQLDLEEEILPVVPLLAVHRQGSRVAAVPRGACRREVGTGKRAALPEWSRVASRLDPGEGGMPG